MKTISISDILKYPDGAKVEAVEGVLTAVYDIKSGTVRSGQRAGEEWQVQNFVIRGDDGSEVKVTTFEPMFFFEKTAKGKRIKIESSRGQKGLAGVVTKHNSYRNKLGKDVQEVTLSLTDNAIVYWVTPGGNISYSAGDTSHAAPTASHSQPAAAQGGNAQQPGFNSDPVATRVANYLKVLDEVLRQVSSHPNNVVSGMPLEYAKDIATTITLSYRGAAGSYAAPVWADASNQSANAQSTDASDDDIPFDAAPGEKERAKSADSGWRFYPHPTLGKKLGELPQGDMQVLWAKNIIAKLPKSEVGIQCRNAIMEYGAEKRLTMRNAAMTLLDITDKDFAARMKEPVLSATCVALFGSEWKALKDADLRRIAEDPAWFIKSLDEECGRLESASADEDEIPI